MHPSYVNVFVRLFGWHFSLNSYCACSDSGKPTIEFMQENFKNELLVVGLWCGSLL